MLMIMLNPLKDFDFSSIWKIVYFISTDIS